MSTTSRNTNRPHRVDGHRRALLALLVAAGFLFQQSAVHLHLALGEHAFEGTGEHGHAAHAHVLGDHAHEDHSHGPHPHPVEDHEVSDPALVRSLAKLAIAPPASVPLLRALELASSEPPRFEGRAPRRPPPRSASPPRAPPVAL